MPRHFIDTSSYSAEELLKIVDLAVAIDDAINCGVYPQLLAHKNIGMLFEHRSTRTNISFRTAASQLGGNAQFYDASSTRFGAHEDHKDTAENMSALLDALVLRISSHETLETLASYSSVPVINALTDLNHPTQELSDLLTILDAKDPNKELKDLKLVFVGDGTEICASAILVAAKFGMHFVHYGPKDAALPDKILNLAREEAQKSGAVLEHSQDRESVKGADFLYTDVLYGNSDEKDPSEYLDRFLPDYQINKELLDYAGDQCKVLHCLPANRGEEITAEVLDSDRTLSMQQTLNRLKITRALLVYLIGQDEVDEEKAQEPLNRIRELLSDK